jgi:hypothetical protein
MTNKDPFEEEESLDSNLKEFENEEKDFGKYCVCSAKECPGRAAKFPNQTCDDLKCPNCGGTMVEEEQD